MTRLAVLVTVALLALCACSSPGADANTISASTSEPAVSAHPSKTSGAFCGRVMEIVRTASRSAVAALAPAIRTGDPQKLAAAQSKAQASYRQAARSLRAEAAEAPDLDLKQRINAAAAYFANAAQNTDSSTTDDSLAKLAEACA